MEAPKCRTCGERHWSRLCSVTPERSVTSKPVRSVTPPMIPLDAQIEIEVLHNEIAMLKRKLAEAGVKATACPECERRRAATAERVRKSRAKQHG